MKTYSAPVGSEKLEMISCSVCGSSMVVPIWNAVSPFVRCKGCGVVYQNPQPVMDDLVHRYQNNYFEYETENEDQFFDLMLKGLNDVRFFQRMERFGNPKRFLDVGCATGKLIKHMKDLGWEEHGVEVCGPAAAYGREQRNVSIFTGTLENARFQDNYFSVVHCSHLIEHLTHPREYVQEVYRIMQKKGWFLVVTPNIDGFQSRLFGYKWRSAIMDHLYLFSKKTLSSLLRQNGFLVREIQTWGGLCRGAGPLWLKAILDPLAKQWGFGDVMLILAEKQ